MQSVSVSQISWSFSGARFLQPTHQTQHSATLPGRCSGAGAKKAKESMAIAKLDLYGVLSAPKPQESQARV